jgi:hypothetical protein
LKEAATKCQVGERGREVINRVIKAIRGDQMCKRRREKVVNWEVKLLISYKVSERMEDNLLGH